MLNITQIKNFAPADKLYRKTDSNGLVLEVKPSGVKAWRYRYKFEGKATMMALGNYPAVSLAEARRLRDEARLLLDQNINPREYKANRPVESVSTITFGEMFAEWFEHNRADWSEGYADDVLERCTNHLLPHLADRAIGEITAMDMLAVFKTIEARGTLNMLKKVKGYASRVFRYSVGMGRCAIDPTRDLPDDVFKKEQPKRYATTVDPVAIGGILRAVSGYAGYPQVRLALMMAPHVFLRPSELCGIRWDEVDYKNRLIRIPAARMKMKRPHIVPLSDQVLDLVMQAQALRLKSDFLFESPRSFTRPIVADTLRSALRRLGVSDEELTTHGFRHMASTLLNEQGWPGDAIERQLAHVESNKIRGTYNQAEYLDVRRDMMQGWSDYLEGLV